VLGEPAAGCRDLEAALAEYRRTGAASELPYFLILYADVARLAGLGEVGQRALDEARRLAAPAIIHRARDRPPRCRATASGRGEGRGCREASACCTGERVDRGALALELRAAADLRRMEPASGGTGDAAGILRSAVEKFTEGHDLPDLRDTIELLA
jgi:hypothetical protein